MFSPAAMLAAASTFVMVLPVMVAVNIGVKVQLSGQIRLHCLIRAAGSSAVKLDPGLSQGCLSTAADAAANQDIRF